MSGYQVLVLKEGYSKQQSEGVWKCDGTITLLKGDHTVLVDTGSPWDRDILLNSLKENGLTPGKVDYVVCTHGHSDHIGNLNLFLQATHIVSHDICRGDVFSIHDFKAGIPYEIDEHVEVLSTPGHTGQDVSVIVRNTDMGTVAVVGDLFECFEDLETPQIWQDVSEEPDVQQSSRIEILRIADVIIPGHGPMFKVPDAYKQNIHMVMVGSEPGELS